MSYCFGMKDKKEKGIVVGPKKKVKVGPKKKGKVSKKPQQEVNVGPYLRIEDKRINNTVAIEAISTKNSNHDPRMLDIAKQNYRNLARTYPFFSQEFNGLPLATNNNYTTSYSRQLMWRFTNEQLQNVYCKIYKRQQYKEKIKFTLVSIYFDGNYRTLLVDNATGVDPHYYIDYKKYNNEGVLVIDGILNGELLRFDPRVHFNGDVQGGAAGPSGVDNEELPDIPDEDDDLANFLGEQLSPPHSPRGGAAAPRSRSGSPSLPDYDEQYEMEHFRFGKKRKSKKRKSNSKGKLTKLRKHLKMVLAC